MYQYFKAKAKNPFVYPHPFFNQEKDQIIVITLKEMLDEI